MSISEKETYFQGYGGGEGNLYLNLTIGGNHQAKRKPHVCVGYINMESDAEGGVP